MLARMTSRELTEWMAFYQLEPFGPERGDLQAGIVASTVANVNRDPKKTKAFKPEDFLPTFEGSRRDESRPTWQRLLEKVKMLNAGFGGRENSGQ